MSQPEALGSLKEADIRDAIQRAGGGRAIHDRMKAFRRASERMEKDHKELLEKYPGSWVAVGAKGLITRAEAYKNPGGFPAHKEAVEFLVEEMARMGFNNSEYVLEYMDPEPETLIL